jgi:hypothetical protein
MTDTAYLHFLEGLFPGDIERMEVNPNEPLEQLDEGALQLLRELADCSGVPLEWLQDAAGLVLNGLAGAQCLWYLHGAEGTIKTCSSMPDWVKNVMFFARRAILQSKEESRRGIVCIHYLNDDWNDSLDWNKGNFTLVKGYRRKTISQTFKLGKWLERYIEHLGPELPKSQADEWRRELKHRAKHTHMVWRVSADPVDVLTMSYQRPWTSCMRPGQAYQFGPLTDMAAGAAVLFFFQPGADKPCGRMILRPVVDVVFEATIAAGYDIYGCGPKDLSEGLLEDMLADASGSRVPVKYLPICGLGRIGRAMTRNIYSDVDRDRGDFSPECKQATREYNEAYELLKSQPWPEPRLESPYHERAEPYFGRFQERKGEIHGDVSPYMLHQAGAEAATNLFDSVVEATFGDAVPALEYLDWDARLDYLSHYNFQNYDLQHFEYLALTPEQREPLVNAYMETLGSLIERGMTEYPSYLLVFNYNVDAQSSDYEDFVVKLMRGDVEEPRNAIEEIQSETLLVPGWRYRISHWFDPVEICFARQTRFPHTPAEVVRYMLEDAGGYCHRLRDGGYELTVPVEDDAIIVKVATMAVYPESVYQKLRFLPKEARLVIKMDQDVFRWQGFTTE